MESIKLPEQAWDQLVDLWEKVFYAPDSTSAISAETKKLQDIYFRTVRTHFHQSGLKMSFDEYLGLVAYEVDCRLKKSRKPRRF